MKRIHIFILVISTLLFCNCNGINSKKDSAILSRTFLNDSWERFDYITTDIEIDAETTYDLSLDISFTDAYRYKDFSMVFSIFDANGNPYRSKAYTFNLKDDEGIWKSELIDGCYTFNLPVNKALTLTDLGKYTFQIEYRMPITPLEGVRNLKLYNNK